MSNKIPVAILTADWHLRHDQPVCRTDNYREAQWERVAEVIDLAEALEDIPILIAGDLFDRACPPLWFVNECLNMLQEFEYPHIHVIPGNHDLPQHSMENLNKSALYSLALANLIHLYEDSLPEKIKKSFTLFGVPFGHPMPNQAPRSTITPLVAMLHMMVWHKDAPYHGIGDDSNLKSYLDKPEFQWPDIILTGDCHKPFAVEIDENRWWVNPGTIMRFTVAQKDYRPRVYVLYDEGGRYTVEPHYFDDKEGVIDDTHIVAQREKNEREEAITGFIERVNDIGSDESDIDFWENLRRFFHAHKTDKEVQKVIMEANDG